MAGRGQRHSNRSHHQNHDQFDSNFGSHYNSGNQDYSSGGPHHHSVFGARNNRPQHFSGPRKDTVSGDGGVVHEKSYYKCGETGHLKPVCPKWQNRDRPKFNQDGSKPAPPRQEHAQDRTCHNCHAFDHFVKHCPSITKGSSRTNVAIDNVAFSNHCQRNPFNPRKRNSRESSVFTAQNVSSVETGVLPVTTTIIGDDHDLQQQQSVVEGCGWDYIEPYITEKTSMEETDSTTPCCDQFLLDKKRRNLKFNNSQSKENEGETAGKQLSMSPEPPRFCVGGFIDGLAATQQLLSSYTGGAFSSDKIGTTFITETTKLVSDADEQQDAVPGIGSVMQEDFVAPYTVVDPSYEWPALPHVAAVEEAAKMGPVLEEEQKSSLKKRLSADAKEFVPCAIPCEGAPTIDCPLATSSVVGSLEDNVEYTYNSPTYPGDSSANTDSSKFVTNSATTNDFFTLNLLSHPSAQHVSAAQDAELKKYSLIPEVSFDEMLESTKMRICNGIINGQPEQVSAGFAELKGLLDNQQQQSYNGINMWWPVLMSICMWNQIELLKQFHAAGINCLNDVVTGDKSETCLHIAAKYGSKACCLFLIQELGANPLLKNAENKCAASLAESCRISGFAVWFREQIKKINEKDKVHQQGEKLASESEANQDVPPTTDLETTSDDIVPTPPDADTNGVFSAVEKEPEINEAGTAATKESALSDGLINEESPGSITEKVTEETK